MIENIVLEILKTNMNMIGWTNDDKLSLFLTLLQTFEIEED